jgi:hypothetical protein
VVLGSLKSFFQFDLQDEIEVEAPITNHLRDSLLDLEKYTAVQVFAMQEDGNQEDCKIFNKFIP